MKYTDRQLQSWTAPLFDTEKQRAENAINMINSAIKSNDTLKDVDIEVFTQGLYANNTNVRMDSDVDVCTMLKNTFVAKYPTGKKREDYGFTASDFTFNLYRNLNTRSKFYSLWNGNV